MELFRVFVLAEDAGVDELVDQLLHAVESGEEALGRHDDAEAGFRSRRLAVASGLKGDAVKTNHVAGKVDLPNAVDEVFSFHLSILSFNVVVTLMARRPGRTRRRETIDSIITQIVV